MPMKHGTKANSAQAAPTSQVEQLKARLRQFVRNHKHAGSLFPWETGKQLNQISNAYGSGSGKFSDFMEKLGSVNEGGIGIPKQTGYQYLNRYRAAVELFPEPVIVPMLANNILPNKEKVLDGARNNPDIVNQLNGLRGMQPKEAAKWAPSVVSRIKEAAARIKPARMSKYERVANTICRSFRSLLQEGDSLYKPPSKQAKQPTAEQLTAERSSAYRATLDALKRLALVKVVETTPTQVTLEHEEWFVREV
jgi:hypothetical protein